MKKVLSFDDENLGYFYFSGVQDCMIIETGE